VNKHKAAMQDKLPSGGKAVLDQDALPPVYVSFTSCEGWCALQSAVQMASGVQPLPPMVHTGTVIGKNGVERTRNTWVFAHIADETTRAKWAKLKDHDMTRDTRHLLDRMKVLSLACKTNHATHV
jgi:hypothetical protein